MKKLAFLLLSPLFLSACSVHTETRSHRPSPPPHGRPSTIIIQNQRPNVGHRPPPVIHRPPANNGRPKPPAPNFKPTPSNGGHRPTQRPPVHNSKPSRPHPNNGGNRPSQAQRPPSHSRAGKDQTLNPTVTGVAKNLPAIMVAHGQAVKVEDN